MKYINFHKELISRIQKEAPSFEKWECRIEANNLIKEIILNDKNILNVIKKRIENSEFKAQGELRALKSKIIVARKGVTVKA